MCYITNAQSREQTDECRGACFTVDGETLCNTKTARLSLVCPVSNRTCRATLHKLNS